MKRWSDNDYIIRLWLSSILFVLLGSIFTVIAASLQNNILINFLNSIGAVLIVSGVYNVINEYILKSKLIDLIVGKINLKSSIDKTGITDIVLRYDDITYREHIQKVTSDITIVHAYGETWTRNNIGVIEDACLQRKLNVTVVLLSPKSEFCNSIDKHYRKPAGNMICSIKNVTNHWIQLGRKVQHRSTVKIYYFDGNPVHSLYKFDEKIIVVSNKINNILSLNLPCIICIRQKENQTCLYQIYEDEIKDLINDKNLIYTNQE